MMIKKRNIYRFLAVTLSWLIMLDTTCIPVVNAKTNIQTEAKVVKKPKLSLISRRPYRLSSKLKTRHPLIPAERRWEEIGEAKHVVSMATTGGKLFAVTRDNRLLVRDADPATQKWRDIGNAGNAIAIAGAKGKLFAVTKDNNLLVTAAQGWKKIGNGGNTIAIAIARGKLFGITNDNKLLVRDATPSAQGWKNVGEAGNALSVTSIGGNLLAVTKDNKLLVREAIPSSAPWSTAATTTSIISMSSARGKIFGLSKDGKLQFQPLPGVQPPPTRVLAGIRIPDLPTWLQALFTPRRTNRRTMGTPVLSTASKQQLDEITTRFEKIERTAAGQKAATYEIKKAKKAYGQFEKKKPRIETGWLMMTDPSDEEETLRVLIFDGPVELTQTLTHEGLPYPLDNPSIRIPPPSPYIGYIIVADRIVLKQDIQTKGHDLVLVAKEISVADDVTQVSLNTQPGEMEQAAQEQEGGDGDNGGDIIILTKDFRNQAKVQLITTGGKGRDGGNGRPMSNPGTVNITKEETTVIDWFLMGQFIIGGVLRGTVVNSQPGDSFYDDPPSCWFDKIDATSGEYYKISPCPERGQYGLIGGARDSAYLTTAWIDIDSRYYPTHGRSGGYGGLPGKISLFIQEAPAEIEMAFSAETGSEGAPGKGGTGGEFTPTSAYILPTGELGVHIQPYINSRSKDKVKTTSDIFYPTIITMPSSRLHEALEKTEVTGAIRVYYYASIDSKNSGDPSRLSEKWPVQPRMTRAAFLYRCLLTGLLHMWLPNLVPYNAENPTYWPSTLGLTVSGGRDGAPLPPVPIVTEGVSLIEGNWYNLVYELLPEYPERLAKRADRMYRAGDFPSALPFYQDVVSFSNNSAFESDELVSDALYRIDLGNLSLDYFGFQPDMVIPISPSRDIDLMTHYSSAVRFFNESIRDAISSGMQLALFIGVLEEFARQHTLMMAQIEDSITDAQFEFAALMLEMEAMGHEVAATHRANIRMGGLLETWLNYVNDRVEKLKSERPDDKPDWQVALETWWNCVKFAASIIAVVYGFYAALISAIEAVDKLAEMNTAYIELQDSVADAIDNLESISDITNAIKSIESPWKEVTESAKEFFDIIKAGIEAIDKPIKEASKLYDELKELNTTSHAWTEDEAIDFRNNVLLADQIDVSGGMTYLQIQEQIKLNNDLLVAKYLALEAANTRGMGLTQRIVSLTRELLMHETDRRYLLDIIDALDVQNATISSVQSQLNDIGQGVLDAMMRRLQEHKFQLKFLELDFAPTPGRYDRFIESSVDVGTVLDSELQLREDVNSWTSVNANIGRLKVVLSRTDLPELGKLVLVSPFELENFSAGEYARPLNIYKVEPLHETQLVQNFAEAISVRLSDTAQLVTILTNQYPTEIGVVIKEIVDRERQYHSILNDPMVSLEDREVVLAYALVVGGVTPSILGQMLSQSTLVDPLKSSLQKLQSLWPSLSIEIRSEDMKSLRRVSQAVALQRPNPSAAVAILNDAFMVSDSSAPLSRFHIYSDDVQNDIAASYDPDFPDHQVLGSIHNSDDLNVVLAITLLYAGFDTAQLQAVANQYSAGHPVGARVTTLLPEWDNLRRSVLERRHTVLINVDRDDFMALPNVSGTFEHRFLAGRSELVSPSGSAAIGVVLKKLPEDRYERKTGGSVTIAFLIKDQLVFSEPVASPPSFVLPDYHYNALFGRSVLGGWELSLNTKGNTPSLPNIQRIDLEIVYSYKR